MFEKKHRQSAEIKAKFINEHRWLKAKDYSKLESNNPIFENESENETRVSHKIEKRYIVEEGKN